MNMLKMPEGYYLLQETGNYYIVKDDGCPLMKRLLDKNGEYLAFGSSAQRAANYAQKHKDAGLRTDQAVSEEAS